MQVDRLVCPECVEDMRDRLHSVRGLVEDLDVALARQAKVAVDESGARSASAEQPLPFGWAASEAIDLLAGTLQEWATTLAVTHNVTLDLPSPPRTRNPKDGAAIPAARSRAVALARWLAERVEMLAQHPDAEDAFESIVFAIRTGFHTIDRQPDRKFAGPCGSEVWDDEAEEFVECREDLYAHPSAAYVVCRLCDAEHPVDEVRAFLLDQARGQLLTATGASRALPGLLGREITAATIRNLAARGSLTQHPPIGTERHPMYNVGQLIDVLIADEADAAIQRKRRKTG